MKYTIVLVMIAMCIFAGCKKSNKSTGPSIGSMSATINGKPFTAKYCSIGSTSSGGLYIYGYNDRNISSSGYSIDLQIRNYVDGATGTYALNFADQTVMASLDSNSSGLYSETGSITINTSTSSAISGTFSFTCINGPYTWTVTNGVFTAVKM